MKAEQSGPRLQPLASFGLIAAYQLLRVVPGTADLRRDLRDAAWLSDADATIISFPKSGRTYVRAMLARLYQRRFEIDERDLLEFPTLRRAPPTVPRVLFTHAGGGMRRPGEMRIAPADYTNTNLVLLARHPGDVVVSRYHHLRNRSRHHARRRLAEQPLEAFVWTEQGGIPSVVDFMNQFAQVPGVSLLRFEDFVTEPEVSLRKLSRAIGLTVDAEDLADAVAFASLRNLKDREQAGYFRSARLRPVRNGKASSGKVRNGSIRGYRSELGPEQAARIDAYVHDRLDPRFGYQR